MVVKDLIQDSKLEQVLRVTVDFDKNLWDIKSPWTYHLYQEPIDTEIWVQTDKK